MTISVSGLRGIPLSVEDQRVFDSWLETARNIRPVLFAGAGLSLNADPKPQWRERVPEERRAIPPRFATWDQLANRLRAEMPTPDSEENDALRLAQYFEELHGRHRLHTVLVETLPDELMDPGEVHHLVTEIDWAAILTTNYDTLITRAYENSPRGPLHVVQRDSDLSRPRSNVSPCELIHLHGTLSDMNSVVLTAHDYRCYADRHPVMLTKMRQLLAQHPVLIVGFSLDDPNFYAINGWVSDLLAGTRPSIVCVMTRPVGSARRAHWARNGIRIVTLQLPASSPLSNPPAAAPPPPPASTARPDSDAQPPPGAVEPGAPAMPPAVPTDPPLQPAFLHRAPAGIPQSPPATPAPPKASSRELLTLLLRHTRATLTPSKSRLVAMFGDATLRHRIIDTLIGGATSTESALGELERLLQQLPRLPILHDDRAEAWQRFGQFVIERSGRRWAHFAHTLSESDFLRWQTADASLKRPDTFGSENPLAETLKELNDDEAARWLFLAADSVGMRVTYGTRNYDIGEYLSKDPIQAKLTEAQLLRIELARCVDAYESGSPATAEAIEARLRAAKPGPEILTELDRLRELSAFRRASMGAEHGPSADLLTDSDLFDLPEPLKARASMLFWYGKFDLASQVYEKAAAAAKRSGDVLSESFAVSGLLHSKAASRWPERNTDDFYELRNRSLELSRDPKVQYWETRVEVTQSRSLERLLASIQREAGALRRGQTSRAKWEYASETLRGLLWHQESSGAPPPDCGTTAELLGTEYFHSDALDEAVTVLSRYGSERLEKLLEENVPESYFSADSLDKGLAVLVSPGRAMPEWISRLKALPKVIAILNPQESATAKGFLRLLLRALHEPTERKVTALNGASVGFFFTWALVDSVTECWIRIADYDLSGPRELLPLLESELDEAKHSVARNLWRIPWGVWKEGSFVDAPTRVRLIAVMDTLVRNITPKTHAGDLRTLLGAICSFVEEMGRDSTDLLLENASRVLVGWLGEAREDRYSWIRGDLLWWLSVLPATADVKAAAEKVARSVLGDPRLDGLGNAAEVSELLGVPLVEELVQAAERGLASGKASPQEVARFAATLGKRNATQKLRQLMSAALKHGQGANVALVRLPLPLFSGVAEEIRSEISTVLRDEALTAATPDDDKSSPGAVLRFAVVSAVGWILSGKTVPKEWLTRLASLTKATNEGVAVQATVAVGAGVVHSAWSDDDQHVAMSALKAAVCRPGFVREAAAYWLGRTLALLSPEEAENIERLVLAQRPLRVHQVFAFGKRSTRLNPGSSKLPQ